MPSIARWATDASFAKHTGKLSEEGGMRKGFIARGGPRSVRSEQGYWGGFKGGGGGRVAGGLRKRGRAEEGQRESNGRRTTIVRLLDGSGECSRYLVTIFYSTPRLSRASPRLVTREVSVLFTRRGRGSRRE